MKPDEKEALRRKRHKRLRYKVAGTAERPAPERVAQFTAYLRPID